MKTHHRLFAYFAGLFLFTQLLAVPVRAQDKSPDQSYSPADLKGLLAALAQVRPTPFAELPRNKNGQLISAGFFSAQRPLLPPSPGNFFGLDAWNLGENVFVLNDQFFDYAQAEAALEAEAATNANQPQLRLMSSGLNYGYSHSVYLANMFATNSGGMTVTFDIAGGTNLVPYDILTTSALTNPISAWTWLGLGYTSNRYTFNSQPSDHAFYLLAKPSKTMTVGFGNDSVGQCAVPFGLTNVWQVAGGGGQSLALKTDGTVVAWGANYYGQGVVPANLAGVAMIAAGWYHNVALLTNGLVTAWGFNSPPIGYPLTAVPPNLTNVCVIAAQALHSLALTSNGLVVAWGYSSSWGETNVPAGLSNVVAIAAGYQHNLAVKADGTVTAWGNNGLGQCNVPAGLSNVVDVAAGLYHSLVLLKNGTVVAWGDNSQGAISVPAGLTNVVAIAAAGDPSGGAFAYSLALKSDGTLVQWGNNEATAPVGGLNHVLAIAAGADHALAVRTGPPTPVVTLEPVGQFKLAGNNAAFTVRGAGLYGVTYQWQTNGVNLPGATNPTLTLTNVQPAQQGSYRALITDNAGNGTIASSNAALALVTPPVFTYQNPPTNPTTIYGKFVALTATASAPGDTNGYPISYQWQFNGTNLAGITTNSYSFYANDNNVGTYKLIAANAVGSTNVAWQVTLTNALDVTQDLLLIYNTNSAESTLVKDYYLAHRPMVGGANVLGIGCSTTNEIVTGAIFNNQILATYLNWLTNNPTKHPQYLILFPDIPTRVNDVGALYPLPSVQFQLAYAKPPYQSYVTSINMNGTNDCIGYINKLAAFGSNYSSGKLVISASAGGYGNTNFVLDGIRYGFGTYIDYTSYGYLVSQATNGLLAAGISPNAILYADGLETVTNSVPYLLPHRTNAVNVAGYISWGVHSSLGPNYAAPVYLNDTKVAWTGNSGWWIIETVESHNGNPFSDTGNFFQWFSPNAFGGSNYSNTPIGAVTYVYEPSAVGVNNSSIYFGLWAGGKNFAICAWKSIQKEYFQAVGDPFIIK
jgi:hypothetical protein